MLSRTRTLVCGLAAVAVVAASLPAGAAEVAPTSFVDPLIGTSPPGFVNPGPQVPHGMVALGPDTEGPLNYGGYFFENNTITGFSHTHMSAGVYQGGQIPVMPVTGDVSFGDPLHDMGYTNPVPTYASPFSHATEVAEPGYYRADLARYGVTAELTSTERTGLHRYTFPPGLDASVLFDVSRDLKGYHDATVRVVDEDSLEGWVTTEGPDHTVFFAAEFDRPAASFTTIDSGTETAATEVAGQGVGALYRFGSEGGTVRMKVGLSFVDVEGARSNLAAELEGWDFDAIRATAVDKWNQALRKIEVTGSDADMTSFYTGLYHAQLFPNVFSDADGRYMGPDGVIRSSERTRYTQFSLWDSYRGQNQLLATISPDRYGDMIESLLAFYRESGTRTLPRWQLANQNPGYMSGDPVIPFIAEGWCRGLVDPERKDELFEAMVSQVDRGQPYDDLGYKATPVPGNLVEVLEGGPREAGTTLEYGVADFALGLIADDLQRTTERDLMLERASYYRNLLDPETRWIRPRHEDGSWLEDFYPENGYGFQEGTSWQYSWLVMHDLAGLVEGMGGDAAVQERLDTLFSFPASAAVPVLPAKVQNQITVFGIVYRGNQYAPGNEHDLEAPYVYNYAGAPWKTQAAQRGAVSLYTPTPDGLPGNDDLGALSGWLVWSMLGLYPMTPGAPVFTIASPVFERAVLHLPTGDIVIEAPGSSFVSKYVQSVNLNAEAVERTWLTASELAGDTTLSFEMGPVPNTSWGTGPGAAPPSLSANDPADFDCRG